MKLLLLYFTFVSLLFASFENINSFEADFIQTITDDKNKILNYEGKVIASKPSSAVWNYSKPITKNVYINSNSITIVEPEIEQVIIKDIASSFDFFHMLQNAKKITDNSYITEFNGKKFSLIVRDKLLYSISYIDEFENLVKIIFSNQKYNQKIDEQRYVPLFSLDFDIVRD